MSTSDEVVRGLNEIIDEQRQMLREGEDRLANVMTASGGIQRTAERGLLLAQIVTKNLQRLQREYAMLVLTVYEDAQLIEWYRTADPDTRTLVRKFAHFPRGTCENCGVPAPLFSDTRECAWGCMLEPDQEMKMATQLQRECEADMAVAEALEGLVAQQEGN